MDKEIKIGKMGKIVAGNELGHYIKVVDDADNTGGFLILTATTSDMREGFDNWVENEDVLISYFKVSGWVIEWSEEDK